jgi:hypothetical protein
MSEYELAAGAIVLADHHDDLRWGGSLPCDGIQAGPQALDSTICRHYYRYAHLGIVAASAHTNLHASTRLCPAVESTGDAVGQMMRLARAPHATLSSLTKQSASCSASSTRDSSASAVSMRENNPG